jgi:hypothetical protein
MLCIQNKGEVEIESLFLLGASTKRNDNKKIGMFGSGNKYAIATLLRKGVPFRIFSGLKEFNFTVQKIEFRNNNFDVIYINGEKTSLTTDMGMEWEIAFCLREFISNAIDEGEYSLTMNNEVYPEINTTKIYIEETEEIVEIFKNITKYFCFNDIPIITLKTCYGNVSIYNSDGNEEIFYRKGIRCNKENSDKTYFRYNFDDISINESRVYDYSYEPYERIAEVLLLSEDKDIIETFIKKQDEYKDFRDAKFNYTQSCPSQIWIDVIGNKKLLPVSLAKIASIPREDLMKSIMLPDDLVDKLKLFYPDLESYGDKTTKFLYCEMTKEQKDIVDNSILSLWDMKIPINENNIKTVKFKNEDIMGMYHNNEILLSVDYIKNQKTVELIILEEYFHSLGYSHGSREYDNFLIECIHSMLRNETPDILK